MSKLAEKIRKASRIEAAQIGFVTSRSAKEATMLLGGIADTVGAAAELAKSGADFVIVRGQGTAVPPNAAAELPSTIAGAWIEGDADAKAYKQAGFDFVLFDADRTASTAVLEESIGYVMTLPKDAAEVELRALEGFALDAIDVGAIAGALTVRRQMDLRKVAGLTRKPLLVHLSDAGISVAQLHALRDTNVIAVLAASTADVAKLRGTIDALPPRARRRDEDRPSPLVPAAAAVGGDEEDDYEDE